MLYIIVFMGIILDQITKIWANSALPFQEMVPVCPFFNLFLTYNKGVSFSLFATDAAHMPYYLSAMSLVICLCILFWIKRETNQGIKIALALILSGAIGNVIDRLRIGQVIDFIDVYYKTSHWPAFNIADSLICIGAMLILIQTLFFNKRG